VNTLALAVVSIAGDGTSTSITIDLEHDPVSYQPVNGTGPLPAPSSRPSGVAVEASNAIGSVSASLSANGRLLTLEFSQAPAVFSAAANNQVSVNCYLLYEGD